MAKRSILNKIQKRHIVHIVRVVLFLAFILFITGFLIAWGYQQSNKDNEEKLGVSFSVKYANELGNDWKKNLLALMDEVEIEHYRFMSYWDTVEIFEDEYVFNDLDWQFDQAQRHGSTVSLAIGQRQPRWPECHVPTWAEALPEAEYYAAVLEFIEEVVLRYRDHPALASYQLENEAANRLFGECREFDREFLQTEFDLVKSLDGDTPVIINASNQSGIPLREPIGDKVGFSVYKRAHFEAFGRQWPWSFWYVPTQWHSLRAALVEGIHDIPTLIHELQAEPWGPVETVHLTDEEQQKTMDPDKLVDIVDFALSTGIKEVYLWGGEWWYWRLNEFNDHELWDTVKQIYN